MDLRSFGRKMRVTGATVVENATALVRRVALAVDAELVYSTPVDTGRARSNWQVELDQPATGTVAPVGAAEAIARAEAKVQGSTPGGTIHITNNLPYIGRLNEGWSAQAPAGFVERAVLNGALRIRGAKLLVKRGGRTIGGNLGEIT